MRTHPAVLNSAADARTGAAAFVRDILQLSKPRITGLVIFTFGGGLLLAPGAIDAGRALIALLGTTLIVAAANALNMYLERDRDGLMRRTARRPLPEGRLAPFVALSLGAMLASAAIPMMLVGGGFLVAALGLFAFYAYVWGYTPLKRRSWLALYVGAIPGALPPLMGWATATGQADAPALALFAVMFVWQIPHFVAIAIFRAEDYAGAGFRVLSLSREPVLTRADHRGVHGAAGAGQPAAAAAGGGRPAVPGGGAGAGPGLRGDRRAGPAPPRPRRRGDPAGAGLGQGPVPVFAAVPGRRCSARWRSTGR